MGKVGNGEGEWARKIGNGGENVGDEAVPS